MICCDDLWWSILLHRFLQKSQCSPAVATFGDKGSQHLALVIDSPSQIVSVAIDLYEGLVEVPAPVRICVLMNPTFSYFDCENWAEPVPAKSYHLMADVDALFMKEVFNITERWWKPHILHEG